jgi:hypothetical protein
MRAVIAAMLLSVLSVGVADAGTLSGQARGLDGAPVGNVTVIVVNANNEVIRQQTFRNGRYSITIPDNQLFARNISVSILFSAPGRDDARLDGIVGTQVGQNIDITMPLKLERRRTDNCPPAPRRRFKLFHRCR